MKRITNELKKKTPFFLYDVSIINQQCDLLLKNFLFGSKIFYSVKTNSNISLLKRIKKKIYGAEITSLIEMKAAKKAGFDFSEMIFTCPGKIDEEIKKAIKLGISLIIVESFSELRRINKIADNINKKQKVLLRLNLLP